MFIICDQDDLIVDIATRQENLSRGYTHPGYKLHVIAVGIDARIGDTYKNETLTENQAERDKVKTRAEQEKKISDQIRSAAVDVLKAAGQLPADFED